MIYGERIRLRAINRDDLPQFVEWLNDPEVRQGVAHYLPFSIHDEERWFDQMSKQPMDEHPLMIEVKTEADWVAIGDCGLFGIDRRVRVAELGIFIGDKTYWNRGYGSEAVALLLEHGFNTLNLNRIFLRVYENNPRAIRAYEKTGFVHEGRLRQGHFHNGEYLDVLLMGVLRAEWQE
jgi:diamine N-acetyltransferase